MLVSIGRRSQPGHGDVVGMFLECHERIRVFIRMAEDVAFRDDVPDEEASAAYARCERYFAESFPLHVEDEERSLLPRLLGLRADVDLSINEVQAQHGEHEGLIRNLIVGLGKIRLDPRDVDLRQSVRATASRLAPELERHLALEERTIFPLARSLLSPEKQADVIAELRARHRQRVG